MSAGIAIQLYTLRGEPPEHLPAMLDRLARIGFDGVEPVGFQGCVPSELRRRCDEAGLRIPACHLSLPAEENASRTLDQLAEAEVAACVLPMVEAAVFAERDRVLRLADRINRYAERAARTGIRLGYHNHQWEFAQHLGGVPAHRVLFDALAPDVFAEIDVYWARVGGVDPADEISRLGSRAHMLHMKDGPAEDPDAAMTALGRGRIDLERVLACSLAGWHIVEIDDCEGDLWTAVEESCAYLRERTPAA